METLPSGSSGRPVAKTTVGRVRVAKFWAAMAARGFREAWDLVVDNRAPAAILSVGASIAKPAWTLVECVVEGRALPPMNDMVQDFVPGVILVVGVFGLTWLWKLVRAPAAVALERGVEADQRLIAACAEAGALQSQLKQFLDLTPRIHGIAFSHERQLGQVGEVDLIVDITTSEPTSFNDDWRLDVSWANGIRALGLAGRISVAHSFPVGRRLMTLAFPYAQVADSISTMLEATLERLTGTDHRGRVVTFASGAGPAIAALGLDVHLNPINAGLRTTVIDDDPEISLRGYLLTLHSVEITNRSEHDMSLDIAVQLHLQRPAIVTRYGSAIPARPISLRNRAGAFHEPGILHVPARQTRSVNMAFVLEDHHVMVCRGLENITDDLHTVTLSDRVSGKVRCEPFTLLRFEPDPDT